MLLFFQGQLVDLSCSKHGSRSLDAIWKRSSTKTRVVIASELSKKESAMNNNNFGKFVSTNCALSLFKRARQDWDQLQKTGNKKRELFSDIIGSKADKKREAQQQTASAAVKEEDKELDANDEEATSPPKKKKKKATAKSYLDDL